MFWTYVCRRCLADTSCRLGENTRLYLAFQGRSTVDMSIAFLRARLSGYVHKSSYEFTRKTGYCKNRIINLLLLLPSLPNSGKECLFQFKHQRIFPQKQELIHKESQAGKQERGEGYLCYQFLPRTLSLRSIRLEVVMPTFPLFIPYLGKDHIGRDEDKRKEEPYRLWPAAFKELLCAKSGIPSPPFERRKRVNSRGYLNKSFTPYRMQN